jgi:hypothetical protein
MCKKEGVGSRPPPAFSVFQIGELSSFEALLKFILYLPTNVPRFNCRTMGIPDCT